MGDADHAHATAKTSRTDSTADVRTVFKRVECERNRHTGAVVRKAGAICLVCTRKGLKPDVCFLTGSVSTLRSHIVRQDFVTNFCPNLGMATVPLVLNHSSSYCVEST
ncbi:hypothetical protein B0H10DRAFT_2089818, partial [Mycena sp. CBHHK59/15]